MEPGHDLSYWKRLCLARLMIYGKFQTRRTAFNSFPVGVVLFRTDLLPGDGRNGGTLLADLPRD